MLYTLLDRNLTLSLFMCFDKANKKHIKKISRLQRQTKINKYLIQKKNKLLVNLVYQIKETVKL